VGFIPKPDVLIRIGSTLGHERWIKVPTLLEILFKVSRVEVPRKRRKNVENTGIIIWSLFPVTGKQYIAQEVDKLNGFDDCRVNDSESSGYLQNTVNDGVSDLRAASPYHRCRCCSAAAGTSMTQLQHVPG
jgi:hypothetical protein